LIAAYAGRRIDAADTTAERFPLNAVPAVRARVADALRRLGVEVVVGAAACGADLVVLEAASELGIRRRIVLPLAVDAFRKRSVADRPGDWGPVYDRIVAQAAAEGDLCVLDLDGREAFIRGNDAILEEALALGRAAGGPVRALVVWDGPLRERTDYTANFARIARRRQLELTEVGILT